VYVLELAGEDDPLALLEARSAASGLDVLAPGLALAEGIRPERVRTLAFTRRAATVTEYGEGGLSAAVGALESATPVSDGTVAVRARDVRGSAGVDTQAAERRLGGVLDAAGWTIDLEEPDHELGAWFAGGTWVLGWLAVESVRDYGDRRPTDRPFFQPGGMDPLLARAIANLAIGPRDPTATRLLDPMCGTGGILTEGGLVGAWVLGSDAQERMVRGTRANLSETLPRDRYAVLAADATALPLADRAVDAVVFDAPYGRQSKVAGGPASELVAGALAEARRVAPRAVVVGDRSLTGAAADAGWTVSATVDRRVHRSLTRHLHLLE
jgi:tRNA (guanine10-N2)-dimethyltransferase